MAVAYQDGANGQHGIDGNPGSAGGNGNDGSSAQGTLVNPWRMHAMAGDGGSGGNGGNGIPDGTTPSASGGDGGHGGNGGAAMGDWFNEGPDDYRNVYAWGGHGGQGGMAGNGTEVGLNGFGGNGGDGGSASAIANLFRKSSKVSAQGGNGGDAFGQGATSGSGGGTSIVSLAHPVENNSSVTLVGVQLGGDGGNGFVGADAGKGASVLFGGPGSFEFGFHDDNLYVSRNLFLSGFGGSGGSSEGGLAGSAGNASVDLNSIASQLGTKRAESYRYDFLLTGGGGGNGISSGSGNSSGTDGGNAIVMGESEFRHLYGGTVRFEIYGGDGGAARGNLNSGNGGNGGSVELGNVTMNSQNLAGSNRYTAMLQGGNGGDAHGTGMAGNGADVNFDNNITNVIQGQAGDERLTVDAIGGAGGNGLRNGSGGSASIRMDQVIHEPDRFAPLRAQHLLRATAEGGDAGSHNAPMNQADGGDAYASVSQRSQIALRTTALAVAGIGNHGKNGAANASANSISTGFRGSSPFALFYSVAAYADASFSLGKSAEFQPTHGTTADAFANAEANEDVNTVAQANAWGGWGSIESGNATARSRAINFSTGTARANSESFSTADRNADTNNNALSTSYSSSLGGRAESNSMARSIGHFNRGIATATSIGTEAMASTRAETSTASWAHHSVVYSETEFRGLGGARAQVNAQSHSGFRTGQFIETSGLESNAELSVAPTVNFSTSMLDSTSLVNVFTPDSDVLALGRFSGGAAGRDSFNGSLTIESHVDVSLELLDHQVDQSMMMALFDVESTGAGFNDLFFRASYNDNLVVDRLFTSVNEAMLFFDESVFDLGRLNGVPQTVDWGFDFLMTTDNADDSFGFSFVFGNGTPVMQDKYQLSSAGSPFASVPEPSGLALVGIGLCALLKRKRRHNGESR